MSELTALLAEKQKLTDRLKELETVGEGLENEENRQRVRQLDAAQSELMAQKRTVEQKLSGIQSHLNEVNDEINQVIQ